MIVRALWGQALGLVAAFGLLYATRAGWGPAQALFLLAAGFLGGVGLAWTAGPPPSEIRLSPRWTPPAAIASVAWLFAGVLAMDAFYRALHGVPTPDMTLRGGPGLLALVAGCAGLLLLHEGVHWAAFRFYGARPRFCLLLKPFPGAAVYAEHHPLPRWAMAVVMLGPAALLTLAFGVLLTVPALGAVAVWGAGLNLSGAVVDFAMAAWLWHLPRGTWVEDLRDGVRLLEPAASPAGTDAAPRASRTLAQEPADAV